jgi:hypothetical protein
MEKTICDYNNIMDITVPMLSFVDFVKKTNIGVYNFMMNELLSKVSKISNKNMFYLSPSILRKMSFYEKSENSTHKIRKFIKNRFLQLQEHTDYEFVKKTILFNSNKTKQVMYQVYITPYTFHKLILKLKKIQSTTIHEDLLQINTFFNQYNIYTKLYTLKKEKQDVCLLRNNMNKEIEFFLLGQLFLFFFMYCFLMFIYIVCN